MTGQYRPPGDVGATAAAAPPVSPSVIRPGAVERLLRETHDRTSTFASQEFLATVREDFAWEGLHGDVSLLSLDVFDTVLIREDVSEIRRFWEIAKLIAERLEAVDSRDLLIARLTATRASYRCSMMVDGYREGELDEIHRLALGMLGLDGALTEVAVAAELEYEAAHLIANPAVRALWESWGRPELCGSLQHVPLGGPDSPVARGQRCRLHLDGLLVDRDQDEQERHSSAPACHGSRRRRCARLRPSG